MKPTQTRPIVEGALLAAVAVVLIILGTFVPVLGLVLVFLWPIPIIVIHMRHGARVAVLTIIVAGVVLSTILGPLQAATTVISVGSLGLMFGYGFRAKLKGFSTLLLGAVAVLGSLLVTVAVGVYIMNVNLLAEMINSFQESTKMAAEVYERLGMYEQARPIIESFEQSLPAMRLMLPAVLVTSAFLNALINYQVAVPVLGRLGYQVPTLPPFAEWRLPSLTVLVYTALLGLGLLGPQWGLPEAAAQWLNNGLLVSSIAFAIHGLALLYWAMTRYLLAKWFKVLACFFVAFSPALLSLAQWTGILDSVIDIRQLVAERSPRPPTTRRDSDEGAAADRREGDREQG